MTQAYLVRLRGASFLNDDGSSRQEFVAECRRGDQLQLAPEPDNPCDRHAVAVLDRLGRKLGYLPSDARDASSLLRGEPVSARVEKILGGTRWWHRLFRITRNYGLLIRLEKGPIDWSAQSRHREVASQVDKLIDEAISWEKRGGSPQEIVAAYQRAMGAVNELNKNNVVAASHRWRKAPINRLTMLLGRMGDMEAAVNAYDEWRQSIDPVGIPSAEKTSLEKRVTKFRRALRDGQR
jgi:hypothetical protein